MKRRPGWPDEEQAVLQAVLAADADRIFDLPAPQSGGEGDVTALAVLLGTEDEMRQQRARTQSAGTSRTPTSGASWSWTA